MKRPRSLFLAAAAIAGVAAIAPPLDTLADRSFTWHMLQHLVLLFIVPLFVLLARPFELFAAVAGKTTTARFVRATRPLHVAISPPAALAFFVATLWLTHFSGLYELSLENVWVHIGEHLLYLAAGTAFWLPVLAPAPLRPLSYPARMLYLALALPQGALVAMALSSARAPLYPYYALAGSVSQAVRDQHDAAALMWIGGGMIVFCAFLLTLAAWAHRESDSYMASRSR